MPDYETPPDQPIPAIKIEDSTVATLTEQAIVIVRLLIIIVGSFGTVAAMLKARDLTNLIAFFRSTEGAGVIAAATTLGTIVIGLWRTYAKRRRAMIGFIAAPNRVAVVTKK